eukprot:c34366_g1_i1 orf=142-393(-)
MTEACADRVSYLTSTYTAQIMPGMYPRHVSRRQIQNSNLHPYLKKTPRGGRKIARKISAQVAAVILFVSISIAKAETVSNRFN